MTAAASMAGGRRARAGLALGLLRHLEALPVHFEAAALEFAEVALADYPGGHRPSATVVVTGRGTTGALRGRGEHVAWTAEAHRALARGLPTWLAPCRSTVGALSARLARAVPDPLARAALESAVTDLALLQAELSLAGLIGAPAQAMRWVVSFGSVGDPLAMVARKRCAADRDVELKIDVDATWSEGTWRALADVPGVAVLDWKSSGTAAQLHAATRWFPQAWQEDPADDPRDRDPSRDATAAGADSAGPPPQPAGLRISRDATILSAHDIVAAARGPRPAAAINIKIPRVGGLLEAVRCFSVCEELGLEAYVGGMFEVGVGRAQARALAALLSPDGPNDLAPHDDHALRVVAPRWRFDPRVPGLGVGSPALTELS